MAAQYKVDASHDEPTDNTLVACGCDVLTSQLRQIVGPADGMQYPGDDDVPHERFQLSNAKEAHELAEEITRKCEQFIDNP